MLRLRGESRREADDDDVLEGLGRPKEAVWPNRSAPRRLLGEGASLEELGLERTAADSLELTRPDAAGKNAFVCPAALTRMN